MSEQEFELPPVEERPLVTFALFAYNQEKYIREAVEGAFSQTYEPLEIILSDDCSTDRTFEIMQEMAAEYKGPHKVVLNCNENNLGICGHVNTIFNVANGNLVVFAAGDDVSSNDRVRLMTCSWIKNDYYSAIIHSDARIKKYDKNTNIIYKPRIMKNDVVDVYTYLNNYEALIIGATAAYTKDIYTYFGSLNPAGGIEDKPMVFRGILRNARFIYINEPLVTYRYTGYNVSSPRMDFKSNSFLKYIEKVIISLNQNIVDFNSTNKIDNYVIDKLNDEINRISKSKMIVNNNLINTVIGLYYYTCRMKIRDVLYVLKRFLLK